MKYSFLIFILLCAFQGNAQLSERNRRAVDSLYPISSDKSLTIEERCHAYNRIGWATIYQDYHLGLKYSTEYLDLAIANKAYNRIPYASHFKGYSEMMLGDFEAAYQSFQTGLKVALAHNNEDRIAELYGDLGNLKNTMGQTSEALIYHIKSLELAEKNKLAVEQARAKINIGKIYEIQGKYKLSLETFQEALDICIQNKFTGYMSSIHENLGDVNLSINEYKTAEKNYKQALYYAENSSNPNRQIQSLKKLGKINHGLSNLKMAEDYFKRALEIASERGVPFLQASLLTDIASIKLVQNKYDSALKHILESIALFKSFNIKENLEETYLVAAQIHEALNKKNLSKSYYLKSYALAKKTENINVLKQSSNSLAKIFERTGNKTESLKYYKEYIAYNNKKRDEDGIKDIIRLELDTNYRNKIITDSLSKINEIKILSSEFHRKEEQRKYKTYVAYSGIATLAFILFILAYFFIQKRKSTVLLSEKNKIISKALNDKEILLKEVHHRVKNNMQVVSSLLQLKSINTSNALAKDALLDSKKRIDSMQLAHQKMYQKGNYEQIDITEYCQDIVNMLLQSIKRPRDQFIVHGVTLFIQVEQAQALGFIVHELITNSIKYAWDKNQPKIIEINITKTNNEIKFEYSDNGKGMPPHFNPETASSFGIRMMHSLTTRQLLGTITFSNKKGTTVNIKFNAR